LRYRIAHAANGYGVKKPKTQIKIKKRKFKSDLTKPYNEKDTPLTIMKAQPLSDFTKNRKIKPVN